MKISVLVPVYGVEKYIARCAESLFSQTYRDLEFVFVDDCTPDRSIAVLHEVMGRWPQRAAQVRILRNDRNRGVGYVRQRLIDESTGGCITFVDSDDYLPPRAIELLAAEMERSGADIVDGAWQGVTCDGVTAVKFPCREHDTKRYLALMLCQNLVPHRLWGRLFKRSVFAGNGVRLVPGIDLAEDYTVMTRLMFYASRSTIDDPVYFYSEENTASYTHVASLRHLQSYLKACRVVLDFFTANDTARRYLTPLQFGMVNALRIVRRSGYGFAVEDELLGYRPQGAFFHLMAALFRGKCPYRVAEVTYLLARKVYVSFMLP